MLSLTNKGVFYILRKSTFYNIRLLKFTPFCQRQFRFMIAVKVIFDQIFNTLYKQISISISVRVASFDAYWISGLSILEGNSSGAVFCSAKFLCQTPNLEIRLWLFFYFNFFKYLPYLLFPNSNTRLKSWCCVIHSS